MGTEGSPPRPRKDRLRRKEDVITATAKGQQRRQRGRLKGKVKGLRADPTGDAPPAEGDRERLTTVVIIPLPLAASKNDCYAGSGKVIFAIPCLGMAVAPAAIRPRPEASTAPGPGYTP